MGDKSTRESNRVSLPTVQTQACFGPIANAQNKKDALRPVVIDGFKLQILHAYNCNAHIHSTLA
jgi:hypothetical protein